MSLDQDIPGAAADDPADEPAGTEAPPKKPAGGRGSIQVDGFKIKADFRPADLDEPAPRSWREVRGAVHAKLMSIAVNLVGAVDDGFIGARKLIRGLAEIPAAKARLIDRIHDKVDRCEAIRQEKALTKQGPAPDSAAVVDQLEILLRELQAEGYPVRVQELEDGTPAIVIVRPEQQRLALRLAQAALPAPDPAAPPGPAGLPIDAFLPPRVARLLGNRGIATAHALAALTAEELVAGEGFGEKSLVVVRAGLARIGLKLRGG